MKESRTKKRERGDETKEDDLIMTSRGIIRASILKYNIQFPLRKSSVIILPFPPYRSDLFFIDVSSQVGEELFPCYEIGKLVIFS